MRSPFPGTLFRPSRPAGQRPRWSCASGQSFAISGLLDHRTTDIFNKMPGIGDVPVLGQLFRSKNVNHSTVELMVIVTPTLVDPLTDTTSPTATEVADADARPHTV